MEQNIPQHTPVLWRGLLSSSDSNSAELGWNAGLSQVIGKELDKDGKTLATYLIPPQVSAANRAARVFISKLPPAAQAALRKAYGQGNVPDLSESSFSPNSARQEHPSSKKSKNKESEAHRKTKRWRSAGSNKPEQRGFEGRRIKRIDW